MEVLVRRLVDSGRKKIRLRCKTCDESFESYDDWRKFCSPGCYSHRFYPQSKPQDQSLAKPVEPASKNRERRVKLAPGLTRAEVRLLLRQWKRQGRKCTYCDAPATTVDHVLPLCRGGSQYIGNLAPACRTCNSRKSSMLLIEFKAGRMSVEQRRFAEFSESKRRQLDASKGRS